MRDSWFCVYDPDFAVIAFSEKMCHNRNKTTEMDGESP